MVMAFQIFIEYAFDLDPLASGCEFSRCIASHVPGRREFRDLVPEETGGN